MEGAGGGSSDHRLSDSDVWSIDRFITPKFLRGGTKPSMHQFPASSASENEHHKLLNSMFKMDDL